MNGGLFGRGSRSKSMREGRVAPAAGSASAAAVPSTDLDASLSSRTSRLQQRIASHDRELLRLRGELRSTKAGTRQHKFYAKRAAQVLSQKKAMEKRLAAAMNMGYNLTVARDEADATTALAGLQPAASDATQLRRANEMLADVSVDPEEVDDVIEDIRERMRDVEEVSQMLGRDDLFDEGVVDDEELEAELMAEMQELPPAQEGEEVGGEEYLKRLEQLMPAPHEASPTPYRPPPNTKTGQDGVGRQARQQRPTRRGGD